MKRYMILVLVFFLNTVLQAQNPADKIIGVWLNDDKTAKIEFFKAGSSYSGKIVWLAQPYNDNGNPRIDKNNPDPNKRNRKISGLTIITGLKYSSGKWFGGSLYGPRRGQYFNCSIVYKNTGQILFSISKGSFSKTEIWTKS
jgi:uncharacterized protein (DUF2147 family)